jgi:hypothetical protein
MTEGRNKKEEWMQEKEKKRGRGRIDRQGDGGKDKECLG